jgi:penicillin amidase
MAADSAAAAIWWTFWSRYLHDTFDPWWSASQVPSGTFDSLRVGPDQPSLDEDLESWTLHDPSNPAFTPPGAAGRTAAQVMRRAFTEAVAKLRGRFGPDVSTWRWGRLHTREFSSLAEIPGLGYGPRAAGSDLWTVNAASGEFHSDSGPSWRMIVDWGSGKAEGVYPGGQSENPASSWYETDVNAWWNGRYFPLYGATQARRLPGSVTWAVLG